MFCLFVCSTIHSISISMSKCNRFDFSLSRCGFCYQQQLKFKPNRALGTIIHLLCCLLRNHFFNHFQHSFLTTNNRLIASTNINQLVCEFQPINLTAVIVLTTGPRPNQLRLSFYLILWTNNLIIFITLYRIFMWITKCVLMWIYDGGYCGMWWLYIVNALMCDCLSIRKQTHSNVIYKYVYVFGFSVNLLKLKLWMWRLWTCFYLFIFSKLQCGFGVLFVFFIYLRSVRWLIDK